MNTKTPKLPVLEKFMNSKDLTKATKIIDAKITAKATADDNQSARSYNYSMNSVSINQSIAASFKSINEKTPLRSYKDFVSRVGGSKQFIMSMGQSLVKIQKSLDDVEKLIVISYKKQRKALEQLLTKKVQ